MEKSPNKEILDVLDNILIQKIGNTTNLVRLSKVIVTSHLIINPLNNNFIDNEKIIDNLVSNVSLLFGIDYKAFNLDYESAKAGLGLKNSYELQIHDESKEFINFLQFVLKVQLQCLANSLAKQMSENYQLPDIKRLVDTKFVQREANKSDKTRWAKIVLTSNLVPSVFDKSKVIDDENYLNIFTSVVSTMVWDKNKENFDDIYYSINSYEEAVKHLGLENKSIEELQKESIEFIYIYELILKGILKEFIDKL